MTAAAFAHPTLIQLLEEAVHAVEHDVSLARDRLAKVRDLLLGRTARADKGGLAPWQCKRVEELVEQRLEEPLRNDDLASAVRLSAGHFCTAFRQSFGMSPHAFLLTRRIERAKALMRAGGGSLAEIALDCGFSDQAHFSRIFRQISGSSPSAWRRAHAPIIAVAS